jgi:hypothetical protein
MNDRDMLLQSLEKIDAVRRRRNLDWVNIVVGPVGAGKSTLSLYCCEILDKNFTEDKIALSAKELMNNFLNAEQYSAILYDEGLQGLMSRRAMSSENVEQIKAFNQLRQGKNLVVFIVVQDLNLLEKHIHTSRANAIFRCIFLKDERTGDPIQGFVKVYGKKAMKKIKKDSYGNIVWPKENYMDRFPDMRGTAIWETYEKRAMRGKQDNLARGIDKISGKDKNKKSEKELKKEIETEYWIKAQLKNRVPMRSIANQASKKFNQTISTSKVYRINKKLFS